MSRLAAAQAEGLDPHVALTGGTVADAVHHELGRMASADSAGVDWSRVDVWWGDERFVPRDSPDRNARAARAAFLDPVGVETSRVHEVGSSDDFATVAEAADAYGREIRTQGSGAFEVVMLGVGPDGHVASLFPGHSALDVDDEIAVSVTDSPKPPPERVSLTLPALNRTARDLAGGERRGEGRSGRSRVVRWRRSRRAGGGHRGDGVVPRPCSCFRL